MDSASIDRRKIARKLREVIDPELGVNIVDLGLAYNILCDDGRGGRIYGYDSGLFYVSISTITERENIGFNEQLQ